MKPLEKDKLIPVNKINIDPIGVVYYYEGKIVRLINPAYSKMTKKLLNCGLIQKLVKEELLVDTWESDLECDGYNVILESKRIQAQSYLRWTFDMLKDAALLIIRINKICNQFGYELKDAHLANVMFDGIKPVWIDFGSIVRKKQKTWRAEKEYLHCVLLPLAIWSKGYHEIVGATMRTKNKGDLNELMSLYLNIPYKAYSCLSKYVDLEKMLLKYYGETKIEQLSYHEETIWGGYQDKYWKGLNGRFDYEINYIEKQEDVHSMIELGANQGVFSYQVFNKLKLDRMIATDYDSEAVNTMYRAYKEKHVKNVLPLVMDFVQISTEELKAYKSDVCVANALTHHLLLTQKMPIQEMVNKFSVLAAKYLIVEFTPTGVDKNRVPSWYTEKWFIDSLREGFEIIQINREFKGRVIIIGRNREYCFMSA